MRIDGACYCGAIEYEAEVDPEKPVHNCFAESFSGTFRDECSNEHWFTILGDARRKTEA